MQPSLDHQNPARDGSVLHVSAEPAWTWAHRHCSIGLGLASLALVLRRTDVEMFK